MALSPRNFLFLSVTLTTSLTAVVACSSDESGSDDTGPTGPSTTTSTATHSSSSTSSSTTSSSVSTTSATSAAVTTTSAGPSTTTITTGAGTTNTTGAGTTNTGAGGTSSTTDGTNSGAGGTSSTTGGSTEFTLTSPAFADDGVCSKDAPDTCELFPSVNSSFQDNQSPELNWTAGPEGTLSYVVVMHDLTNGFAHWVVWNLSAETLSLPAALPPDGTLTTPVEAQQISLGPGDGYFGPGSCMNVYRFNVYALNVETFSPANTTMTDAVQDELEASDMVLDTATLTGRANPEDC